MKTIVALALVAFPVQGEKRSQPQFEELKKLEGAWVSVEKDHPANVTYRLSSGGSILVESMSMANHSEMLTVYHPDGDDLVLTHYCMLGNQPRMKAEKGQKEGVIRFAFDGGGNMKPNDKHMHSLTITFLDADHVREDWALFEGGTEQKVVSINLVRKKE